MKLQFDANQQYQLDAVAAVTDLFDGQPQGAPEFSVIEVGDWGGLFAGQARTELGVGNQLMLAPDKLLANARTVQARTLYLVRETKSTKDFLKLRTSEADKVRCGKKHFETLGVPFAVVVSADEV